MVNTAVQPMPQLVLNFAFLQLLDFMTTIAFLVNGVAEGNPLVRLMMRAVDNPLMGLALVKFMAMLLAAYCWKEGKHRLLGNVNMFFGVVVTWNLAALIVNSVKV